MPGASPTSDGSVEGEASARPADVARCIGMLKNAQSPRDIPLIAGHRAHPCLSSTKPAEGVFEYRAVLRAGGSSPRRPGRPGRRNGGQRRLRRARAGRRDPAGRVASEADAQGAGDRSRALRPSHRVHADCSSSPDNRAIRASGSDHDSRDDMRAWWRSTRPASAASRSAGAVAGTSEGGTCRRRRSSAPSRAGASPARRRDAFQITTVTMRA